MKWFIFVVLLLTSFSFPVKAQQLVLKHLGGPMGGIIGDIAIDSKDNIYAGAYPFFTTYAGLYKSTDNGNSWKKIMPDIEDAEVYGIYITEDDHIWLGTNFQGRIYLSTDSGETWENKRNGYDTGECWAFGESKDGVLFAGDGQYYKLFRSTDYGDNWEFSATLRPLVFATDSNNIVYAGTQDGLFGTTDNGITWAQNNFLKDIPVATILIDNENNIYCGTGYYDNGNGVYLSTNDGVSWEHLGLDSMIVLTLEFDSEGTLFAGTKDNGLFKTTDKGQTWSQHTNGLYQKQVFRLEINSNDDIFIGSEEEGVFRSTDNGDEFKEIGLPISNAKDIKFFRDSLLFASTPSGVQKYNISTKKWTNIGLHDVFGLDITESGTIYAATFADGLFKSTNFGKDWTKTSLTTDTLMSVYNVLAIGKDTVLAATGANLRKSTDGGNTWEVLPIETSFFSRGMYLNGNELWVIGYRNGIRILFKTSDYSSFDSTFSQLEWSENNCISAVGETIFVTDRTHGTFRSTNNGLEWGQVLEPHSVWTIYSENNGLVLGGARDTIWYSEDYGNNWIGIEVPLKYESNITDIKRGIDGKLYVGTYSEGIYELDILTDLENELEVRINYTLSQNYPNPFNPTTQIKYSVPGSEHVLLKIYDILGREIETLVNEVKPKGTYEIEFDGSDLASGIYFYKITIGSFSDVKKMVLVR